MVNQPSKVTKYLHWTDYQSTTECSGGFGWDLLLLLFLCCVSGFCFLVRLGTDCRQPTALIHTFALSEWARRGGDNFTDIYMSAALVMMRYKLGKRTRLRRWECDSVVFPPQSLTVLQTSSDIVLYERKHVLFAAVKTVHPCVGIAI